MFVAQVMVALLAVGVTFTAEIVAGVLSLISVTVAEANRVESTVLVAVIVNVCVVAIELGAVYGRRWSMCRRPDCRTSR